MTKLGQRKNKSILRLSTSRYILAKPNDDRTQDYAISFRLYNSPHRSPFLPFWLGSHLSIQQIKSSAMARWARQPQVCSFKCSLWQLVNRTAPEFILATRLEMERIKTETVRVAMVIMRLWSVLSSQLLHDFVFPITARLRRCHIGAARPCAQKEALKRMCLANQRGLWCRRRDCRRSTNSSSSI